MRELHVVAMSEDGRHVVLATRKGAGSGEYRVALDERLAAAVRGDLPRPGETEPAVVTPKEIQARLRAGESPEEIAASAGVPVTKIDRYAGPVLSERERVLDQARAGVVSRSRLGESALPLGEAVDRHLADTVGVRLETVEWSARREETGTWLVELAYVSQARRRSAVWRYDMSRREVTATDAASAALAHVEPSGRRTRSPEHDLAMAHLPARRPASKTTRRTAPARAKAPKAVKAAPSRTVAARPAPPVRVAAPVPHTVAPARAAQTAADKAAAARAAKAATARAAAQEKAVKAAAAEAARAAAAAEAKAAKQARAAEKRAAEQAAQRAAKADAARKAKAAEERKAKAEAARKAKAAEERKAKAEAARKAKAAEERKAKAEAARKAKAEAARKAKAAEERKAKAEAEEKAKVEAEKKAAKAAADAKVVEAPPGPPTLRVVGSDDQPAARREPKAPPAAARTAPARAAGQRASVPGWADVLLSTAPVARSADADPAPDEGGD